MKKLIASSVLLCLIASSYGQTDYRPGYVITQEKDTLRGLVDYSEGVAQFRACDFKASKDGHVTTYKPGEIIAYGFVNDKYFLSREIDDDGEKKLAFLEVIVSGFATLYRCEENYVVEKNNEGLHVLKNESEERYDGERIMVRKTNEHVGILNMLFFDCIELRPRLKRFHIGERILTDLVESYNRCKGTPGVTFKSAKPWAKANVALSAGYDLTSIKDIDTVLHDDNARYTAAKSPIVNLQFDILSPRINESVSLHTGVSYQTIKYYGYSSARLPDANYRLYITLEAQSVKIPIGIRYVFPQRKVTPFLNGGASTIIFLKRKGNYIVERQAGSVLETYFSNFPMDERRIGCWVGGGGLIKLPLWFDALVEFRFEKTVRTLVTLSTTDVSSFEFTIGIRTK